MSALTYEIIDRYNFITKGWLTKDGTQTGEPYVLRPEPDFRSDLFRGPAELKLTISSNPIFSPIKDILFPLDMVKVHHPDGRVMGIWKFDMSSEGVSGLAHTYNLHLSPLSAELSEVPFGGNYTPVGGTTDPSPDAQAAVGSAHFDVPILASVVTTKHCTIGDVNSDGVLYDMIYPPSGRVVDTLNRGADQGGSGWWWHVDGVGAVTLRGSARPGSPYNLTLKADPTVAGGADDIIQVEGVTYDSTGLANAQEVFGAMVNVPKVFAGVTYDYPVQLRGYAEVRNAGFPLSHYTIEKIGIRLGPPWRDPSITTQTGVNAMALAILAKRQEPVHSYVFRLKPGAHRLAPGDTVNFTNISANGLWVTSVVEKGSTKVQVVTCRDQLDLRDRPFAARKDALAR